MSSYAATQPDIIIVLALICAKIYASVRGGGGMSAGGSDCADDSAAQYFSR